MHDINQFWGSFTDKLGLNFSTQVYNFWLKPLKPVEIKDNALVVSAPEKFHIDWISSHYLQTMTALVKEIDVNLDKIIFIASEEKTDITPKTEDQHTKETITQFKPQQAEEKKDNSSLNPEYNFDNFVVGSCNRFAHAACIAVAQSPSKAYNPLFIYGGVGLGKTHLMHSIGHFIVSRNSSAKVLYFSSEEFTNELIESIQKGKQEAFRNKYRNVDVILIDDIQFLSKKERTQEEFFHTFNTLYPHKQIVLSSDRPPKEIPHIEERLISRFEWGLVADLQAPDTETKIAILKKKALASNIDIPDNILYYLAEKITSNIRQLQGALIRVSSYASLIKVPLTIELAEEILQDLILVEDKDVGAETIQKIVAEFYNIKQIDIIGKKRSKNIVIPRQVSMYLTREMTPLSLPDIGKAFGGRDHTTIIHAVKKVTKQIEEDKSFSKTITVLKNKINKE